MPRNYERGEDRHNARLTADDVRAIRRLGGTMKDEAIAAQFGVSEGNVGHILKGRTWRHVAFTLEEETPV